MVEVTYKDIKITIIRMFKDLKENMNAIIMRKRRYQKRTILNF